MKHVMEDSPQYSIEKLEKPHNRRAFDCGVNVLNKYLQERAMQDMNNSVNVTYVLIRVGSNDICGYYTLSSISIEASNLPDDFLRKLPKYPILPGVLLGRLAVAKSCRGMKLGAMLLIDALRRTSIISQQLGIMALTVDAKDDVAIRFYKHHGFLQFSENNKLFLPIETIKKLDL